MFSELKLTNFRQHEDKLVVLKDGLNVLRGANEQGKSTLIEAILYLWFGSKALRDSISETVTYGKSEKSLRVDGTFTIEGVEYTAYRSPTGAELRFGDKVVTSQTEVTRFMEALLGAKTDVVRKLMVAEQNSVRGILESDSNAGALIESLAELSTIDTIVEKIKHQLSTGPTKGLELQIFNAKQGLEEEAPQAPDDSEVKSAERILEAANNSYELSVQELAALKESHLAAKNLLSKFELHRRQRENFEATVAKLEAVKKPETCMYSIADYDAARAAEADQKLAQEVEKARKWTPSYRADGIVWNGDLQGLTAELSKLTALSENLTSKLNNLKVAKATKLATKINEGVCSFCKKDISDMPEVAQTNAKVDSEVAELDNAIKTANLQLTSTKEDLQTMRGLLDLHNTNMASVNKSFWEPLGGQVPSKFKWIGPESTDFQGLTVSSKEIKLQLDAYDKALNAYQSAQESLATLSVPADQVFDVDSAKRDIQAYEEAESRVSTLKDSLQFCERNLNNAKFNLQKRSQEYHTRMAMREKAVKDVEALEKLLAEQDFNNQLINDLREARSQIRRELWTMCLAVISTYFTRIRGVESRVAQTEDGFVVNGKPVSGLSGSAKDMLGLAIRAGLIKTFIPTAPLMVVDEPFSGCDETREKAGIATLCTLQFPQTLLVTHSDLADAVADNLIQL